LIFIYQVKNGAIIKFIYPLKVLVLLRAFGAIFVPVLVLSPFGGHSDPKDARSPIKKRKYQLEMAKRNQKQEKARNKERLK
jgi:hypothetical protein